MKLLIYFFFNIVILFSKEKSDLEIFYKQIYTVFPKLAKIIILESKKQNIDPNLTASIIFVESRGHKKHIGSSGEIGLMQIMPYHFKNLPKEEDYFNPSVNIKIGLNYLNFCISKKETLNEAISCYNTGSNAKNINKVYLNKVLKKYHFFKK